MSFDLMVFEQGQAPDSRRAFLSWYEEQIQWEEAHDYQSVSVASPRLQSWFRDMAEAFPPMNGEGSPTDAQLEADSELEERLADYSIGTKMIYAAFAWSAAEEADGLAWRLAKKHGLGLFRPSGDEGEILLPDSTRMT